MISDVTHPSQITRGATLLADDTVKQSIQVRGRSASSAREHERESESQDRFLEPEPCIPEGSTSNIPNDTQLTHSDAALEAHTQSPEVRNEEHHLPTDETAPMQRVLQRGDRLLRLPACHGPQHIRTGLGNNIKPYFPCRDPPQRAPSLLQRPRT